MDQPVFVVDFGTSNSSAAVVDGGVVRLVREPATGSWSWPSSVYVDADSILVGTTAENLKHDDPWAYRTEFKHHLGEPDPITLGGKSFQPEDLVTEVLVALREEAVVVLGGVSPERIVLTVPAGYRETDPAWTAMIQAAERAGFIEVELLREPVAAAFAPVAGGPFPPESVVLVYDFGGGTFDAALVRIGVAGEHEVLAHDAVAGCGGRDVDALLCRHIEDRAAAMAELTRDDDEVSRWHVRAELTDFARDTKHQLSTAARARGRFLARHQVHVDRGEFDELVQPLVDRTVRCCLDVLSTSGVSPSDVDAVLLVGGSSRMPIVAATLSAKLGRPLRVVEDLSTAVVHGAAMWATGASSRSGPARGPAADEKPLRWDIPAATGTLVRWLVQPGERFAAGAPLGVVRLSDGRLWLLLAGTQSGSVARVHAVGGDSVTSDDWLATITTAAPPSARDTVEVRHTAPDVAVAVLGPDGRQLAVAHGNTVTVHDIGTGAIHSSLTCQFPVRRLLFDPEGGLWAVAADETGAEVTVAGGKTTSHVLAMSGITAVDLSPGLRSVAVAFKGNLVRIVELATTRLVRTIPHLGEIASMAFSNDGRRLAVGGSTWVRVWDAMTGDPLLNVPRRHAGRALTFSQSGRWLCVVDTDGAVAVMSAATGQVRCQIAHGAPVHQAVFSPDGALLATACQDGVARVWHAATGTERQTVTHEASVRGVAFTPDGGQLASCAENGSIRLTNIEVVTT